MHSLRLLALLGALLPMTIFAAAPAPLPDDPACTAIDRTFMKRAYEMARAATLKDRGRPFGAVLVLDGKIIAEFSNCEASTHNPTMHAETGLIATFGPKYDRATLARTILYASSEPCTMCCGAIRFAGIVEVVFGTTETQFLQVIGSPIGPAPLESREVFRRTAPETKVRGPLMEKEGLAIHTDYWPSHPIK
jgi:tRNA(Arg) A34 adenosine deaminase TadA